MAIEVNGKILDTDEEGYLVNWNDWGAEVAEAMAATDDIELSVEHRS